MGNLVFLLLTPLSHWSLVRRLRRLVGAARAGGRRRACCWSPPGSRRPSFVAPLWIIVFALLGAGMLGALGLIAGLWAEKFDQMAAFQNFIIMPMTFLSGVFYSIHSLPPFWQAVSHLNPFFYMIDGFRYGFFGVSDVSPWLSLAIVGSAMLAVSARGRAPAAHRLQDPRLTTIRHDCRRPASSLIAAGLPCEHLEVEGDGRHWCATIVSAEFEGKRADRSATSGSTPRWAARMQTDEVHALSMKTLHAGRVGRARQ